MNKIDKHEFVIYLMIKKVKSLYQRIFFRSKRYRPKILSGKKVFSDEKGNHYLYDLIISGKPFAAVRYGSTEISGFIEGKKQEYGIKSKNCNKTINSLSIQSGFFPTDCNLLKRFSDIYQECSRYIDFLGTYATPLENYMVKKFIPKDSVVADNRAMEPYYFSLPWSKALEGKKVLVIHPFEDSIKYQYENNREYIFDNPDILPKFDLLTIKAVQTIVGTEDSRFSNWFEALDYMYQQVEKTDFDIALIGCGAYGLPLASMIRKMGKQAIHIGGALQILFGIKGRRWELNSPLISAMFNEHWIRPNKSESPVNKELNESNGAYW